jgi:hypothetical protein
MTETKKNTLTKHSTKPVIQKPAVPQFANFKKPVFKGPNFNISNAFRNQNRGSGGK